MSSLAFWIVKIPVYSDSNLKRTSLSLDVSPLITKFTSYMSSPSSLSLEDFTSAFNFKDGAFSNFFRDFTDFGLSNDRFFKNWAFIWKLNFSVFSAIKKSYKSTNNICWFTHLTIILKINQMMNLWSTLVLI